MESVESGGKGISNFKKKKGELKFTQHIMMDHDQPSNERRNSILL